MKKLKIEVVRNQRQLDERLYWYEVGGQDVDKINHTVTMYEIEVKIISMNDSDDLSSIARKLRCYKPDYIDVLCIVDDAVLEEAKNRVVFKRGQVWHFSKILTFDPKEVFEQ
jgi:hypothetical protein